MSAKKVAEEGLPTPKEMTAFAREYIKSYLDIVDEKAPEHRPPIAQQSPYHIEICLLPNGCYAMILESAPDMRIRASFRNWDDLQNVIMKGVDFFIGFYPHEMKSIAEWKKRGTRDAVRDIRVLSESKLGKATGKLSTVIEEISRLAATNPWIADKANEQIQMLRDVEERLRRGFAPVDSIAVLQELKAYKPTYEKLIIEFPDKSVLERILDGVEELMTLQTRMETLEGRMFEVERISSMKSSEEELEVFREKLSEIEESQEKMSNILQMLNSKVENYFSKSAGAERQAEMESGLKETSKKVDSLTKVISDMQSKQDQLESLLDKDVSELREELESARKKTKKLERHFVELAKSFED